VNFSIIAAARYAVHQLTGINNDAVIEQVLAHQDKRFVDDPRQTTYEDSPLPDTPEVKALTDQVTAIIHGIDPRLQPSPFWAHILQPGESTMYHTHGMGNLPGLGLSWVYYASVPERSGDLIFICQLNDDRSFQRVTPAVGKLAIFPASMPHMTEKHAGEGPRVSVSGNFFLPIQTTLELFSGQTTSKVTEFSG
jgi:hypothetical protein